MREIGIRIYNGEIQIELVRNSVVDPDPGICKLFTWIRIRNFNSVSKIPTVNLTTFFSKAHKNVQARIRQDP
jgi:hypothetical protein